MKEARAQIEKLKADIQAGRTEEEIFQWMLPHLEEGLAIETSLAEFLGTLPHPVAFRLLRRMFLASKEKKARKVIRRSLYRLKNRGIPIEEMPIEKGQSILRTAPEEPPTGFGGGVDFSGQRLLILGAPRPGHGWEVIQGVISDSQGLVACSGGEIRRKEFKAFLEEVQKSSPLPLVPMEAPYVAFLFSQAYLLTLDKGGTIPTDYLPFRSKIERIKGAYDRPLVYACLEADDRASQDHWLERSGDLLKCDLLRSWRIEEDQIRPYAEATQEAEESKIVLSKIQKEARIQGIYGKALIELFPDERRLLYKRRLEEMAYVFHKVGMQEEARISLAAAADLEKPLNALRPNLFLLQLIIRSISMFLAERDQETAKEPSWIVKP